MASMSTSVVMKTRWNGGFLGAVMRRLFGGETLFVNEFQATERTHYHSSELIITQPFPGFDIECLGTQRNQYVLMHCGFYLYRK